MPRGRGVDAEETRRTIVDVAYRLFMEQGYQAVSTRQIADVCGLTQSALYYHFANKQVLYAEVIKEELGRMHAALARMAGRDDYLEERLRRVGRYISLAHGRMDLHRMFSDIEHEMDPAARQELEAAFFSGVIDPIASIFEQGLRLGNLRSPGQGGIDPIKASFLLLGMLDPEASKTEGDRSDAQHADSIVGILLHGLLAQPAPEGPSDHPGSS